MGTYLNDAAGRARTAAGGFARKPGSAAGVEGGGLRAGERAETAAAKRRLDLATRARGLLGRRR